MGQKSKIFDAPHKNKLRRRICSGRMILVRCRSAWALQLVSSILLLRWIKRNLWLRFFCCLRAAIAACALGLFEGFNAMLA